MYMRSLHACIKIMAVWWRYRGIDGESPCQARRLGVAGLRYKIIFLHGLPGHIEQQLPWLDEHIEHIEHYIFC